jgi:N6-adenosine-specific RNA methylase IME4
MGEKYNIIYADPPWKFKAYSGKGNEKSADSHYMCMNIDDIYGLPVEQIAADGCILFLWVTFPLLEEGLETIRRWGFTYKTCAFNWVKRNKKADSWFMGMGYWTRSNSELCLLATKGNIKRISKSVPQICDARIMQHSEKPAEIRDKIVELCGDLPRIELFARQETQGWKCLGNEIDGQDIRISLRKMIETQEGGTSGGHSSTD